MGVHATYCLICGLPIQHDHYVATDRENVWAIYREDNKPKGHFPFKPEHEWLLCGVAVSPEEGPFLGSCEDGSFRAEDGEEYYVGRDHEDYTALHAYCWHAAGRPMDYNDLYHYKYTFAKTFLAKYQEQLFEFQKCVDDGDGWMLINPNLPEGQRNKERIDAELRTPKPIISGQVETSDPRDVKELLASDEWLLKHRQYDEEKYDFWRFRNNVTPAIDKSGYPFMWWLISDPGDTPVAEMERFEREFYAAVQQQKAAVALATVTIQGRYYFILQTRDAEECQRVLAKHRPPGELEIQSENEPGWTGYFEEFFSRIVQMRGY